MIDFLKTAIVGKQYNVFDKWILTDHDADFKFD